LPQGGILTPHYRSATLLSASPQSADSPQPEAAAARKGIIAAQFQRWPPLHATSIEKEGNLWHAGEDA
jgi:hypothetical protein